MRLDRLMEADKTRVVESLMTRAGFGLFQFRLLLLCGLAQVGAYACAVGGLIAGPLYAEEIGVDAQWLVWPEWLMRFALAWTAGLVVDKFGRVPSIFAFLTFGTMFQLVSCFATAVELYVVCRTFGNFFIGALQVAVYVFVAEICPKASRSRALFFLVLADCIGTLVGCAVMILPTAVPWRTRLVYTCIPLGLAGLLALCYLRKDSVKYMVLSGRAAGAYRHLTQIASTNGRPPNVIDPSGQSEFARVLASVSVSPRHRGRFTELWGNKAAVGLVVVCGLQAIAYWGAMSALPQMYRDWDTESSFNIEVLLLLFVFELVGVVAAAVLSFKVGPAKALLWFAAAGAALVALLVISLALNARWFRSASLCGTFACLTPVWGILFVLTTEAFSPQYRGLGLGFAISTRILQGLLEVCLPYELEAWVPVLFAGIAVFALIGIVYVAKRSLATLTAPLQAMGSPSPFSTIGSPKLSRCMTSPTPRTLTPIDVRHTEWSLGDAHVLRPY